MFIGFHVVGGENVQYFSAVDRGSTATRSEDNHEEGVGGMGGDEGGGGGERRLRGCL